MRRMLMPAAAALAAVVLTACGSTGVAASPATQVSAQWPGSIVFVAGAGEAGVGTGNSEIIVARPTGGVRDLTSTSTVSEYDASWSPDGSRVLFLRRPATRQGTETAQGIYVWTPGHGTPQRIASCRYCQLYSFVWSPDDRQIAFVSGDGNARIRVMNADGSGVHTVCDVKRCGEDLVDPAWSPDGRKLVFGNGEGGPPPEGYIPPRAIWIANADGSGLRQLTQPDCNAVGTLRRKARGCAVDGGAVWSPNGRLIAFVRSNAQISWLPHATGPARLPSIEVMRADGSHVHAVSTCGGSRDRGCYLYGGLAWAPDSKAIAYIPVAGDHRPSSFRITTVPGKTTTIRTCVHAGCLSPFELSWSPNGRQLAFLAGSIVNRSVRVIGRDGKGLHLVSRGGLCCLAWVRNASLSG